MSKKGAPRGDPSRALVKPALYIALRGEPSRRRTAQNIPLAPAAPRRRAKRPPPQVTKGHKAKQMDRAPEIVRAVQAAQGAAAAAAFVQQDPSSQIELELPIDAFAGDADHQKQIHQDFWQGFDPKDLGESHD